MGLYSSYYSYGLPSFLVVVIALYLLFTGMPSQAPRIATYAELNHVTYRLRWSIQCWSVLGRDKSIRMGFNWNWSLHWSECVGRGMVRSMSVKPCTSLLTSGPGVSLLQARRFLVEVYELRGYERRIWSGTLILSPTPAATNNLMLSLSIIFCEVVAIYGVVCPPFTCE